MKSLGQGGSGKPRAKDSAMDLAHALIAAATDPKATEARLLMLEEATAERVRVRDEATATVAEASKRETAAMAAEADARSQREALATETAKTESRLAGERANLVSEKQRLEDQAAAQDAFASDLMPREAALKRAFAAYEKD